MNTPLLSICIPTYNRAHYLDDCLNSLKVQLDANKDLATLIEIVVSDNASSDKTQEIVQKYKNYFSNFKSSVNEKNLGLDLNFLNVVKNANGTYCWYLADDDVIVNGGIDFVITILKKGDYDVVTVGSHPFTEKNYRRRETFTNEFNYETINGDDFFHKNKTVGGVSNLIFNRILWLECLSDDFLPYWLYYETVLKMFTKTHKKMIDVPQTLVYTGQDCRWAENGSELITFVNSNVLLERMIRYGFDEDKINKAHKKNMKKIPIMLLRAKGHGLICNVKNLHFMRKNLRKVGFIYLTLATAIFFLPNFLVILARDAKKQLVKFLK